GNAVINCARVAIDFRTLEAGWIGILQILDDPQASAIVELDAHRLTHKRLRSQQLHREAVGRLHAPHRGVRRETLTKQDCAPCADKNDEREELEGAAHWHYFSASQC